MEVKNNEKRKTQYKRGGNAGVEGTLYQINLLTIFLLNGLKRDDEWYLSTENEDAGKFDDLVFESPEGDIFLQAKHKKNKKKKITYEDLLSTNSKNDDFSLPKYFFSHIEIKDKFDIKSVIICTNNELKIDASLKNHIKRQTLDAEDLLYFEGVSGIIFTFNDSILPQLKTASEKYYDENLQRKTISKDVITDENIKEFLNCLQFLTNYPSKGNLDSSVEKVISEVELAKQLDTKLAYNYIYRKMQDWFKQDKGIYLTKAHAKAFFCEIRTNEYCNALEKLGIFFENNNLPVKDPDSRVWHIIPQQYYLVNVIKIYRALQKVNEKEYLFIDPSYDDDFKEVVIEAFQIPSYVYLMIICSENADEFVTEEICDKVTETLKTYKYKKLILVASDDNELVEYFKNTGLYKAVEEEIEFCDLNDVTQKKLFVKKNVVFQGNDTSLKEMFPLSDLEEVRQYVDSEMLQCYITGEKIKVGSRVEPLDEDIRNYYIQRNFNINGNNFPEKIIFFPLDGNAQKVILISDSPGMGKSTIMIYLANILKKNYPHLWVIKIDINNYTKILWEYCENGLQSINIIQLLDSVYQSKLETCLEKKLFSLPDKIILLIDGVDEVSPDYKDITLNLLMDCKNKPNFAKIYITTRPHLRGDLEKILDVRSLTLSPFSKNDQTDFLTKYWKKQLGLKKSTQTKKCEFYARTLINEMSKWINDKDKNTLAEIPLQTKMLAEVFREKKNLDSEEMGDWEGCHEFLSSGGSEPKLPKKINLVRLYQLFMSKKRLIFIQDKSKLTGNVIAGDGVRKIYEECQLYHQLLAILAILREEDRQRLRSYAILREKNLDEKNAVKLGIVQKTDRHYQFTHRTFAEFFVAECFLLELRCEDQNKQFQNFFTDDVLIVVEYNVIRAFLDGFLQKELSSLPQTIFRAYSSLDYCDKLYGGDNTFLHILTQESCFYLLQFCFKCLQLVEERIDINQALDSWGKTVLHYACQNRLDIVQFLVENGANVNAMDYESRTPLHDAVSWGRISVVKYLLEHDAQVNATCKNQRTALHEAVELMSTEMVELLLENGADATAADDDGRTPLHEAARLIQLDIIRVLVRNGADIRSTDDDGCTPLHEACHGCGNDVIEFFIQNGADVNERNSKGLSALDIAARCCFLDTFKYLVENGADVNIGRTEIHEAAYPERLDILEYLLEMCDVNISNEKGNSALHSAAERGYLDVVQFLVGKGADVNIRGEGGRTPLHQATQGNHLDVVQYLVEVGAEVNKKDSRERTALHATRINYDVMEFLVKAGVDINCRDTTFVHRAVLHYATFENKWDHVKFLVESGAGVNDQDGEGATSLHYAVKNDSLAVARYLIERGAEVQMPDKEGRTVLHKAVRQGSLPMIEFLVESNVDVNAKDNGDRIALHEACKIGRLDIITFLGEKGSEVNALDAQGRIPLHESAAKGPLEAITYLVGKGSKINVKDAQGSTPLISAVSGDHYNTVKFLVENGADVNVLTSDGSSALTRAVRWSNVDIVRVLVENGADVHVRNREGWTPLHIAARWNCLEKMHYLLANGSDVDAEDSDGFTALHVAARPSCLDMVKGLLKKGGKVNGTNGKGETPLHIATRRGCLNRREDESLLEVMKLLIDSGAEVSKGDAEGKTPLHAAAAEGRLDRVKLLVANGADLNTKDADQCLAVDYAVKKGYVDIINFLRM